MAATTIEDLIHIQTAAALHSWAWLLVGIGSGRILFRRGQLLNSVAAFLLSFFFFSSNDFELY